MARASTIFLLSPAYCGGRRAGILLNPQSPAVTSQALRAGTLVARQRVRVHERPVLPRQAGLRRAFRPGARDHADARAAAAVAAVQPRAAARIRGRRRQPRNPDYRSALERDVQAIATRIGTRLAGRAARQRRQRQVRRRAAADSRRSLALPDVVRRPRRHEPRRVDAAQRRQRRRAGIRPVDRRRAARAAPAAKARSRSTACGGKLGA